MKAGLTEVLFQIIIEFFQHFFQSGLYVEASEVATIVVTVGLSLALSGLPNYKGNAFTFTPQKPYT